MNQNGVSQKRRPGDYSHQGTRLNYGLALTNDFRTIFGFLYNI